MKKLIVLLCLMGCGSDSSWSKATQTQLLNRCGAAGGGTELCQCILASLEGQMTEAEFLAADKKASETGVYYMEINQAFIDCEPK